LPGKNIPYNYNELQNINKKSNDNMLIINSRHAPEPKLLSDYIGLKYNFLGFYGL